MATDNTYALPYCTAPTSPRASASISRSTALSCTHTRPHSAWQVPSLQKSVFLSEFQVASYNRQVCASLGRSVILTDTPSAGFRHFGNQFAVPYITKPVMNLAQSDNRLRRGQQLNSSWCCRSEFRRLAEFGGKVCIVCPLWMHATHLLQSVCAHTHSTCVSWPLIHGASIILMGWIPYLHLFLILGQSADVLLFLSVPLF